MQEKVVTNLPGTEEEKMARQQRYNEKLDRMRNLVKRHQEMIDERTSFKKNVDELSTAKRRLEESQQDIRGSEE
jgi:chromosome segregation ATPase